MDEEKINGQLAMSGYSRQNLLSTKNCEVPQASPSVNDRQEDIPPPDVLNVNQNIAYKSMDHLDLHSNEPLNGLQMLLNPSSTNYASSNNSNLSEDHTFKGCVTEQSHKRNEWSNESTGESKMQDAVQAARIYAERFPERRHPTRHYFPILVLKMLNEPNEVAENDNFIVNEGKEIDVLTSKLFDELKENVYKEVASLISANETRPHFLIQLFRDLRMIKDDAVRLRILQSIQMVITHSMAPSHNPNRLKISLVIQPLSLTKSTVPGGVPFKYLGFLFFRGNMSAGEINFPVAEQQHMAVTSCPLSADEIEPTCFFPFKEITFGGRFADV
ncbi:unnamed protein product [Acanthoscelides obtectus]|uniref:Pericentriolar material 1 protein C-terminal domain-containing protein n=1 Tax=Acanthoscelides obtectus TaxID=200917 RepID=A0A9P0L7T8_ACAOB|nr:unnamed protein product [Acanthoscelides obtectus]CAK1624083.1 Pericentriolar material 1 protein [Acanthoscelides obtectus]